MKKSLILALGLAAPIFAGDAVVAPAPIVTPPPPCCPFSLEVAAVGGMATGDLYDVDNNKEIDVYGADITGIYSINENHSINLRFGYTFGDECMRWDEENLDHLYESYRHEVDIHTFSLMPGYRYTHAITEKWSAYIGVNIGIANVSVKACEDWSNDYESERIKAHGSDWGLAYSAEIGVSYKIDADWHVFATYGFFGSTADPDVSWGEGEYTPVDNQNYHGVRIGVGYKF